MTEMIDLDIGIKEQFDYESDLHALVFDDGLTSIDIIIHTHIQWSQNPIYGINKLMDMFNISVDDVIDALGDRIPTNDIIYANDNDDDYNYQNLFIDYKIYGFLAKCTFRIPCNFEFEVHSCWDEPDHIVCTNFDISSDFISFCIFGETLTKLLLKIYTVDRQLFEKYKNEAYGKNRI